jgi:hypothetical protein
MYRVEPDWQRFQRYLRGEDRIAESPTDPYLSLLDGLAERGVIVRRVRVVDFPLPDYLRYELATYAVSARHGEEILLLERALYVGCYQRRRVTGDFWLVDESTGVELRYADDGSFAGEVNVEAKQVKRLVGMKACLLQQALPMDRFLAEAGVAGSAPQR